MPILLYVIGFIVHNSYLAGFGNYEFELIQAKYILSGFGTVMFSLMCFAYISIKVNLSYIFDTFKIDNLLPWLLRVVSLPYAIYIFLYTDSIYQLINQPDTFIQLSSLFFFIGNSIVFFSILDLAFGHSEGNRLGARVIRSCLRILSIPMIIATIIISWNMPEFSAVVQASLYFFFGLIGIALNQEDKKIGIELNYLDENSDEAHKNLFTIFFGFLAIFVTLLFLVTNYVNAIYPKILVALGGAKIEPVRIYTENKIILSDLIQETNMWTLYINKNTGSVEKIKTELVDKIEYIKSTKKTSNTITSELSSNKNEERNTNPQAD